MASKYIKCISHKNIDKFNNVKMRTTLTKDSHKVGEVICNTYSQERSRI